MKLEVTRRFEKDLKRLSKSDAEQAIEAIEIFVIEPTTRVLNFEKVRNRAGYFTIRANFKIRILLRQIGVDEYEAAAIGNHDYIYESYFR
jgi:hypothetical protein